MMLEASDKDSLLSRLPRTRGRMRAKADMAKACWFQAGGSAEVLFRPEDADDLAYFFDGKPEDVPVTVLGVGSNLLVRDGGIEGVVIRLGKGFVTCEVEDERLTVGAGCFNANLVAAAQASGIGGLEFLSGIPGSIGGALAMNAGAYGLETADVLIEAHAMDGQGHTHVLTREQMGYSYRHCSVPKDWIFTRAVFQGRRDKPEAIAARIENIAHERSSTQPVRSRTGGSTFKNPPGHKAWQLIDAAGCRGLRSGGAEISTFHCNFMINTGNATAGDLESLGEEVRRRVLEHSGIVLEWEIKRLGNLQIKVPEMAVA